MKRRLTASVLMLATALFSLGGTANATPHVMFRDSDKWVAGPKNLTPSGPYSWALPEMADATAWEIIDGYPGGVTSDGYTIAPEFRPEREITRAEFAKVLTVATGLADGAGAAYSEWLTLTDRFAILRAIVVRSTHTTAGVGETYRSVDTYHFRKAGDNWKVSSMLPWRTVPTKPGDESLSNRLN